MNVGDARAAAVDWVQTHAADAIGAYFYGSTVELPDDAELPPASDVDMTLVIEEPGEPGERPGKLWHRGALLEASALSQRHQPDRAAHRSGGRERKSRDPVRVMGFLPRLMQIARVRVGST